MQRDISRLGYRLSDVRSLLWNETTMRHSCANYAQSQLTNFMLTPSACSFLSRWVMQLKQAHDCVPC